MPKTSHELRDPIHVFVRLSTDERSVLNSRPFQRLRYIHQLALTYLVYPGATHRRFEHSLGVMELAGRIFDVVTHRENLHDPIRELLPELADEEKLRYWRRVLRMAALCHDIGHLPFSHAAEKELLPAGWDHEKLTIELIRSPEMCEIWNGMTPPLRTEDVVKLAVGPKKHTGPFSDWEAILSEMIVGDVFGADRMDYLLRDSHHAGVVYGRFDHHRLIDTLRLLVSSPEGDETAPKPALGIEEGGLQSAEALLLARYFMYSQLYFHPVRRIYDIHLRDFLGEWLPGGSFSTDCESLLRVSDNEVTAALRAAAEDAQAKGHDPARRIVRREHFKILYERHPADVAVNPEAGQAVLKAASEAYGSENLRRDRYPQKGAVPDFPVLRRDDSIVSSTALSSALRTVPLLSLDYVFINPSMHENSGRWLAANRREIIQQVEEEA